MTKDEANKRVGKVLDLNFYHVKNSYKLRAERDVNKNPDHFQELGSRGGKVSGIKKGFSAMPEEQKRAIQLKGIETRKRNREQAKQD